MNKRSYAKVVQESAPNKKIATIPTNKIVIKQISRKVLSLEKRSKINPLSHNQRNSTITTNPKIFSPFHKHKQSICLAEPTKKQKTKKHESLQSPIANPNFYHALNLCLMCTLIYTSFVD